MMDTDTNYCLNTSKITYEIIDDEVILIHLLKGAYYSIRGVGALIWGLLSEDYSTAAINTIITNRYSPGTAAAEIETDISGFMNNLTGEDLILVHSANSDIHNIDQSNIDIEGFPSAGEYAPPLVEKFTDMQDFLLFDPIHEVDDAGWPHPKTDDSARQN